MYYIVSIYCRCLNVNDHSVAKLNILYVMVHSSMTNDMIFVYCGTPMSVFTECYRAIMEDVIIILANKSFEYRGYSNSVYAYSV